MFNKSRVNWHNICTSHNIDMSGRSRFKARRAKTHTSHIIHIHAYYKLSIYRDYIWYDSAHSTTIKMIKLRTDLHSRKTPHTSPLRARYGGGGVVGVVGVVGLLWVVRRKMTAIYRERTVYEYMYITFPPAHLSLMFESIIPSSISPVFVYLCRCSSASSGGATLKVAC